MWKVIPMNNLAETTAVRLSEAKELAEQCYRLYGCGVLLYKKGNKKVYTLVSNGQWIVL